MRFRTLLIIVLILAAATPALLGWALRAQTRAGLIKAGVPAERIISVAGWHSSRLVFPVPGQAGVEADATLYHGPYLGGGRGWGWAAADVNVLHAETPAARLQLRVSGLARLHGAFNAREALRQWLPGVHWQALEAHFSSRLLDQHWRGTVTANELAGPGWRLARAQLDWDWQPQPRPGLSVWLNGRNLHLARAALAPEPPPAVPPAVEQIQTLHAEQLQLNADWLEQGSTGALRTEMEITTIRSAETELDRVQLAWQAAPLDSATVRNLPILLPQLLQHPDNLPGSLGLQLAPLLALRPQVALDSLVVSHNARTIHLDGTLNLRPGGFVFSSRGGGPRELYLRALQILQPPAADQTAQETAEQTLEQIRRQGWLQRRDDELRADIVINY